MRKPLLVLLLLTYSMCSTAQEITIDQLKSQLEAHPQEDTFRVNRLIELSFSSDFSFLQREKLASEALTLSRKIGYPHGEGIALANVGYYKFRQGDKKAGDSLLRVAQAIANKMDDPELNGVLLYRSGNIILRTNPDKSAVDSFKKAGEAFEKSGDYKQLLDCQRQIFNYYEQYVDNYPLAMETVLKTIHLTEKLNLQGGYIDAMTSLGALYTVIGDHDKALAVSGKSKDRN